MTTTKTFFKTKLLLISNKVFFNFAQHAELKNLRNITANRDASVVTRIEKISTFVLN